MRRRPLRPVHLAAGLLLATPLLAGCGFNYSTDQINAIAAGTNDRSGEVDVLGAVVVAAEPNTGVFAATLVNNSVSDVDGLESVDATDQIQAEPLTEPVEIGRAGHVNLFGTGGIPVTGSFEPGAFVSVQLTFTNGQVSVIDDVPVVLPCEQYSPEKLPELDLTVSEGEAEEGASTARYSCEHAEPVDHHGEEAPEEGEEPVE